MGQHIRISKEKVRFVKGRGRIIRFRIVKAIRRTPWPVYELEDMNGTLIEGQFYAEDLTPFRVTKRTVYKIEKSWTNGIRKAFSYISSVGKSIERMLTSGFLQPA